MRLLADANIPLLALEGLRALGHDVRAAGDVLGPRATDREIAELVRVERRAVVSADRDFCRLSVDQGCVVVVLARPGGRRLAQAAVRGISRLENARGRGRIVVVRERSVRLFPKRPV